MIAKPDTALSVYKNRSFARFARKARIPDGDLWRAAQRANQGSIDADLGGGVVKQRIARAGEGKSGGSRTIILFKREDRAVYVYGFEKKDRANIKPGDLEILKALAKVILGYTTAELMREVENGELVHVKQREESANEEQIPE